MYMYTGTGRSLQVRLLKIPPHALHICGFRLSDSIAPRCRRAVCTRSSRSLCLQTKVQWLDQVPRTMWEIGR